MHALIFASVAGATYAPLYWGGYPNVGMLVSAALTFQIMIVLDAAVEWISERVVAWRAGRKP